MGKPKTNTRHQYNSIHNSKVYFHLFGKTLIEIKVILLSIPPPPTLFGWCVCVRERKRESMNAANAYMLVSVCVNM